MKSKSLNRDAIKYIAILAMLLDHIGWVFLDFASPLSQVFHTVGRITAPIMCYFIAEGYEHTRSYKKYLFRLFVFALISQLPWWIMNNENSFTLSFSMMFTLFLGLLAVHIDETVESKPLKHFLIILLCILSIWCDWMIFAIVWCVGFHRHLSSRSETVKFLCKVNAAYFLFTALTNYIAFKDLSSSLVSSLFTLGSFLSVILICMYNGEKGSFKISKWVFYVFYPLHMLILGLISIYV